MLLITYTKTLNLKIEEFDAVWIPWNNDVELIEETWLSPGWPLAIYLYKEDYMLQYVIWTWTVWIKV